MIFSTEHTDLITPLGIRKEGSSVRWVVMFYGGWLNNHLQLTCHLYVHYKIVVFFFFFGFSTLHSFSLWWQGKIITPKTQIAFYIKRRGVSTLLVEAASMRSNINPSYSIEVSHIDELIFYNLKEQRKRKRKSKRKVNM